jgi:S-adenosylmethionine:tRNA ribosyltransferase-isomerase
MNQTAVADRAFSARSRIRLDGLPSFHLPAELEASIPPEARGVTRDSVKMMVVSRRNGLISHSYFSELPRFLEEGDLVVVNTSGTLAASVAGTTGKNRALDVHLSTRLPADLWTIELRQGDHPVLDCRVGEVIDLNGGGRVVLLSPYSEGPNGVRLWVATVTVPQPLQTYLAVNGKPIKYGYVKGTWPISMYQNVYVTEPGSAEMPSAGRPFTPEVITRLVSRGIGFVPILLHTGVASVEASEPPYPEPFRVSGSTAHRINDTHANGGRVIAIGTTVVRALETVVDERGKVHSGSGWTETVITPERHVRSVDGLLTGWHEPEASHLAMLEAIAGRDLVETSYAAALEKGYLWHEFGDVHLVLP